MTLPLSFHVLSAEIQKAMLHLQPEYLYSRQEPKFMIDVFSTCEGLLELYSHRDGGYECAYLSKEID